MPFHYKETESPAPGPYRPEIWQILLPAFLFAILYTALQSACLLICRYVAASGPAPLRNFALERPGLCKAAMIALPMAAALLPVWKEGKRRLRAFRKKQEDAACGIGGGSSLPTRLCRLCRLCLVFCACALCIFGNAQIQAMGLSSDSVSDMQPVYREVPFPFILLIFAVFTPFVEEMVFRGILYTGLRSRYKFLPSVLLSAALFGLYHGELIQGVYAFCMGLLLGLSLEAEGDLRAPWLLHGISNGLPLALSYFGLWEPFLQRGWRVGALACLLLSAGLSGAFTARKNGLWDSRG